MEARFNHGACSEFEALLEDHLTGDLSGADAKKLAEHLESCAACSSALEQAAPSVELLRTVPATADPGPGFSRVVMARIRAEMSKRGEQKSIWLSLIHISEYGLPAAKVRAANAGLLLAYENSGYDNTRPGRLPDLLDIWSVRRLVAAGADCIKILLYYTPFDPAEVNNIKHAWVERIGAECVASDVPFFLEFVGYEEGGDEKGAAYALSLIHI